MGVGGVGGVGGAAAIGLSFVILTLTGAAAAQAEPPRSGGGELPPGPCVSNQPEAGAPIRVPLGPADFGQVPEACTATSVTLQGRLGVLIASDDFYGSAYAGGAVRARVALPNGMWISLWAPGIEYRFVANATVDTDSIDVSAASLGWHVPLRIGDRRQIAPYLRVLLPTETVFQRATRTGVEHGIAGTWKLHDRLDLVGGYALPLLLTVNGSTTLSLFTPTVAADLVLHPFRAFTIAAGVAVRVVPADAEPFESFDPRASLRFYPWRGALIDLGGVFPLFGRDRTNAAASVALGWVTSP